MRDPLGFDALVDVRYGEGGIGTDSRTPRVGPTLEAIASTIPRGWPSTRTGRSTDGPINKRGEVGVGRKSLLLEPPIWLGEAARPRAALPPIIQRAGRRPRFGTRRPVAKRGPAAAPTGSP